MVGIASADVATKCQRHFVVTRVVRRVQYKFAQGSEVALDAVEVTGRSRRRHQLDIVRSLEGLGTLLVTEWPPGQASGRRRATFVHKPGRGAPQRAEREHLQTLVAAGRNALGDEAFASAWNPGQWLDVRHAVTDALERQAVAHRRHHHSSEYHQQLRGAVVPGCHWWCYGRPEPRVQVHHPQRATPGNSLPGEASSSQTALRWTIVLLFALLALAARFGLDIVLGAFLAGAVLRNWAPEDARAALMTRLDAVAYGFFIPVFFVASGMRVDVRSIVHRQHAWWCS